MTHGIGSASATRLWAENLYENSMAAGRHFEIYENLNNSQTVRPIFKKSFIQSFAKNNHRRVHD